MRRVRADLHVHTCLSPCADAQMRPTAIVRRAKEVGLHMIGICDHNSVENVAAVTSAGAREGLAVVGGMEVTSQEEVHVLALFSSDRDRLAFQDLVYENLPGENDEQAFGEQTVCDQWDNPIGTNRRLLIGATTLSVERIVDAIHDCGGLAVASHVDRERFSLIGQLGFIPEGLRLDAVELSKPPATDREYGYPVVVSSDAHFLDDLGRCSTEFVIEDLSVDEIAKALHGRMGRRIIAH